MSLNRFYKQATIEQCDGGFAILLDGRKLTTPMRKALLLPNAVAAQIIADEWNAQPKQLDPNLMPITRLMNVVLDKANDARAAMVEEIQKYASTDLLCYMVSSPAPIVKKQAELWQPVLDWVKAEHGLEFIILLDSLEAAQTKETLDKVANIAGGMDDLYLTIFSFMTQVLGSVILALALIKGRIDADDAFKAIRIEEDHNATIWGYDDEDLQKSSLKRKDIDAVERLLRAI